MKNATLNILIFFIFLSQHVFGKVTVLHGYPSSLSKDIAIKSICLSEDDGGALVWSSILTDYDKKTNFQFRVVNEFNNNEINCKMNADKGCLESWNRDNWNLTNSLKTPMGPVFDQRWEDFKQYVIHAYTFSHTDFNLTTEVKLPFSVRSVFSLNLVICEGYHYSSNVCYWIILAGWYYSKSVVLKCKKGVPKYLVKNDKTECKVLVTLDKDTRLSEWETFVITWNSVKREINVHDINGIFLAYTDEEKLLHSSKDYHMFISGHDTLLLRFHMYDFLHTTIESAILTSPIFQFDNEMICVQLLIGLCTECDAYVVLLDASNNKVLGKITVKGSSKVASHGLPMWQSVKIESNSINYSNYWTKIQLIPSLNNKRSLNPLWAVANVRQCPQKGALSKSIVSYPWYDRDNYFGKLTCQKLFYDEHAVVSPVSHVKLDGNLDDTNCSEGKIGPQCLFSCQDDLNNAYDCMGTKICYVDGCTCASGFLGDNCSEPCGSNTYGYNCKKTCGSCLYGTSEERCNKVTGVCSNGCNNNKEMVYVPPLCQTSVGRPDEPMIISTDKTIYAIVSMTWKNEYEKISIFYSFTIKEEITHKYKQAPWSMLFRNMTLLIGYFENLEPATNYQIRCNLLITDVQIHSDWQVAVTKSLDEPGNCTFIINNNSVVDLNWLYPWKADYRLGSFRIRIEEIFSYLRESISRSSINKIQELPVTHYMSNYSYRLYLFPSTVYNISIEAVTVANKSSNPKFVKIHTPSNANVDGLLEAIIESDSTILLNIPHVLNDTRDSMMHIIVKGANPCEQYSDVPESLRALAGVMMNETAWEAAKVSTSEFSGQQFRVGDNRVYGNVKNCPLKSEEFYKIVIIVMGNNSSIKPIMLTSSIRMDIPMHYEPWLISIISFLVLIGAAFCLYQSRKRQRRIARLIQAEMALPQDMEIFEVEMNPVISNLMQDLSNLSDSHFLSQAISSQPSNAITFDDGEKQMQLLLKLKKFEDYVRQATQSDLLDKQYNV